MEELHDILQIVAIVLTLGLIGYAYRKLPARSATLLAIAMLGFAQYVMEIFPDTQAMAWVKHLPIYVGMVLLFMFINSFGKASRRMASVPTAVFVAAPVVTASSWAIVVDWMKLMTDEGLQHIFVLPLFAALLIASILRSADSETESIHGPLRWFIAAGIFLTIIHVMEFFVESQGFFTALDGNPVEILELVWYYLAALCFAIGISKSSRLRAPTTR